MRSRRPPGGTVSIPCGERYPTNGQRRAAGSTQPVSMLEVASLPGVRTGSRRHGLRLQRSFPALIAGCSWDERRESGEENGDKIGDTLPFLLTCLAWFCILKLKWNIPGLADDPSWMETNEDASISRIEADYGYDSSGQPAHDPDCSSLGPKVRHGRPRTDPER